MARPALFSSEQVLAAALRLIAEDGPAAATIAAIGRATGAPVGSIYHRFPSREALIWELWLQIVADFQEGFVVAADAATTKEDGVHVALYTPRWARRKLPEARVLMLHRREELLNGQAPPESAERLADLDRQLKTTLRRFSRTVLGDGTEASTRRAAFALIDVPLAAVRRPLAAGRAPEPALDALVEDAYRGIMG